MSGWEIANYGAWVAAALIFFWLVKDFMQVNKEYDDKVLFGSYDPDEEIDLTIEEEGVKVNE